MLTANSWQFSIISILIPPRNTITLYTNIPTLDIEIQNQNYVSYFQVSNQYYVLAIFFSLWIRILRGIEFLYIYNHSEEKMQNVNNILLKNRKRKDGKKRYLKKYFAQIKGMRRVDFTMKIRKGKFELDSVFCWQEYTASVSNLN